MATGTVKWFDDAKGYGFIAPEDGGRTSSSTTAASAARASSPSPRAQRWSSRHARAKEPRGLQRRRRLGVVRSTRSPWQCAFERDRRGDLCVVGATSGRVPGTVPRTRPKRPLVPPPARVAHGGAPRLPARRLHALISTRRAAIDATAAARSAPAAASPLTFRFPRPRRARPAPPPPRRSPRARTGRRRSARRSPPSAAP